MARQNKNPHAPSAYGYERPCQLCQAAVEPPPRPGGRVAVELLHVEEDRRAGADGPCGRDDRLDENAPGAEYVEHVAQVLEPVEPDQPTDEPGLMPMVVGQLQAAAVVERYVAPQRSLGGVAGVALDLAQRGDRPCAA